MNTKIRSFAFCLTACLLACVSGHAYEQDNWYLAKQWSHTGSSGVAYFEDNSTGIGQIYVASTTSDDIKVYNLNGSLARTITIASTRYDPRGLVLDSNGTIYIAERIAVTCLSNDGTFKWRTGKNASISSNGSSGSENGEFNYAFGITIGPDDKLYVADRNNHRIQVLDKNGSFIRKFGSNGTAPGQFDGPRSVGFLPDGNLVVRDDRRLHWFQSDGSFIKRLRENDTDLGGGYMATSLTGEIITYCSKHITTNTYVHDSYLLDSQGSTIAKFTNDGSSNQEPNWRYCFTPDGDIIVSTGSNIRVYKRAFRTKGMPIPNVIPQPAIRGVSQRVGTNILDLDFEIVDSDDTNATVGIFAYCDNQMILPKAWVDGTGNKIGTSIATNQTHRVSWDVKQDWNASTGNIKFEILCQDGRTNKPVDLHFLTLPFPDGNMTISRSPLVWADFVNYALFLLSTGEAQYDGNSTSEITYNGTQILHQTSNGAWVNGTNTRNTLLAALGSNYRFATTAEVTKAREAATPGTENAWDPIRQVVPRNLPYKVNEYGFDVVTKGSNSSNPYPGKYWVIKE